MASIKNSIMESPAPVFDLSRETADKLSAFIKCTDSDENLSNFCYSNENPRSDEDGETFDKNKDYIKQVRGVVVDKDYNIVMSAFPYTPQYSVDEIYTNVAELFFNASTQTELSQSDRVNDGINMCRFYECHEGALIRMFYYSDKWYITTHRRLNAFKSKWGGVESYGTAFKKGLKHQIENNPELKDKLPVTDGNYYDAFQSLLDTTKHYMFLVANTSDNRLVCNGVDSPTIWHVGTFKDGVLLNDDDIFVNKPVEINFSELDEIKTYVTNVDITKSPGLIVFMPGNVQFKISNSEYMKYLDVRGNQPSVKFRYLQIRCDPEYNTRMRELYPDFCKDFDEYENMLKTVTKEIHSAYMDRFIHKKFISVPQAEFAVIRTAHGWFMENRDERKVTLDVIYDILNTQKPTSLNQMIKRVKRGDTIIKSSTPPASEEKDDMQVD